MLHISQIVTGRFYKLGGKTVKLVSVESDGTSTSYAYIVYNKRDYSGFTGARFPIEVNGMTDFEELTSLEKELL
jgi:hypothetical protein